MIKICYFVAILIEICQALLVVTVKYRDNSLSCGSMSPVSSFFKGPVFGTNSLFDGPGAFSKLFWSRESIVHVSSHMLKLCVHAVQGLWGTRVSTLRLHCHWSVSDVFLLAGGCFLGSTFCRTADMWLHVHWVWTSGFHWKIFLNCL